MTYGALILVVFVAILALALHVSWWFLLGLPVLLLLKLPMTFRRARVLAVLAREYQYEFPPKAPQAYTLNEMEREMRQQKLSDHELATLFMAAMCDSLYFEGDNVQEFCQNVYDNAWRLRFVERAISNDVFGQLDQVARSKIGRWTPRPFHRGLN